MRAQEHTSVEVRKRCILAVSLLVIALPPVIQGELVSAGTLESLDLSSWSSREYLSESNYNGDSLDVEDRPTPSSGKIAAEILCGYGVGLTFGLGSAILGKAVRNPSPSDEPHYDAWILDFCVGYVVGSAVGVFAVGTTGGESGSFPITLLGSSVGFLLGIVPAPLGATVGFNITRKCETQPVP